MSIAKVVVKIEGGVVSNVFCSNPNFEYVVLDLDVMAVEDNTDFTEASFSDGVTAQQVYDGYTDEPELTLTNSDAVQLSTVLDYLYDEEREHFEESYEVGDVEMGFDGYAAHEFTELQKTHIFYHLVMLYNLISSQNSNNDSGYTFEENERGNLVIRMATHARAKTVEMLTTSSHTDFDFLDKLLEAAGQTSLGQLHRVLPENIGALTDAPIIGTSSFAPDTESDDNDKVWWYPNYAVSSFAKELINHGEVTFTAAPENRKDKNA